MASGSDPLSKLPPRDQLYVQEAYKKAQKAGDELARSAADVNDFFVRNKDKLFKGLQQERGIQHKPGADRETEIQDNYARKAKLLLMMIGDDAKAIRSQNKTPTSQVKAAEEWLKANPKEAKAILKNVFEDASTGKKSFEQVMVLLDACSQAGIDVANYEEMIHSNFEANLSRRDYGRILELIDAGYVPRPQDMERLEELNEIYYNLFRDKGCSFSPDPIEQARNILQFVEDNHEAVIKMLESEATSGIVRSTDKRGPGHVTNAVNLYKLMMGCGYSKEIPDHTARTVERWF